MTLNKFKENLKNNPESIVFSKVIELIDANYKFLPTAFINGNLKNAEGQNSGSCKLFAFVKLQNLSKEEALACFGEHYRNVLDDPNGNNHQNIRNFMKTGFGGLSFDKEPLREI